MSLHQFISVNNLQPADAIILRKKFLGMVDHFAIYLGGTQFVANYRDGVKVIPYNEMVMFLQKLEPTQIDKFLGNEWDRANAIQRATSRVGERAYNYVANNCEHFKNWVHYGENFSSQVDNAGNTSLGIGIGLVGLAYATRNEKVAAGAVGLLLLGMILKSRAGE